MESEDEGGGEDVLQMAKRLLGVLNCQEETLSLKRRYVAERWPESFKKHKLIGLSTEGFVPESFIREEKEFSGIKGLVENGIAALNGLGSRMDCPLNSCKIERIVEPPEAGDGMSDLETVKLIPKILGSLSKSALKALHSTLSGRQLTSDSRHILKGEIKNIFAKLQLTGEGGLTDTALEKMASVIRNQGSYLHNFQSAYSVFEFNTATPCALAAAYKAFACLRKLPTCCIVEVGKLLTMGSITDSALLFTYGTHSKLVDAVKMEAEKIMLQLKESEPLPAPLEAALHAISLSARILVRNDGGLARLLKPLPPEKLELETKFLLAYNEISKLEKAELMKVCDVLGKRAVWPTFKADRFASKLRMLLIDSMHCIYVYEDLPGDIKEAVHMINNTAYSHTYKRVSAEINAALNVSAAFQSVVWEFYDMFHSHKLEASQERIALASSGLEACSVKVQSAEVEIDQLNSESKQDLDRQNAENNEDTENIETETSDDGPQKAVAAKAMASRRFVKDFDHFAQDVVSFCDEAAEVAFVIIGCLLKDISMRCLPMEQTKTAYLQTGLGILGNCSAPALDLPKSDNLSGKLENFNASQMVIRIAKQLKTIPKSVISNVEQRM